MKRTYWIGLCTLLSGSCSQAYFQRELPPALPSSSAEISTYVKDIDGDGDLDRIELRRDGSAPGIYVYEREGTTADGSPIYLTGKRVVPSAHVSTLAFSDVNGDRRVDLVYWTEPEHKMYVFYGRKKPIYFSED